MVRIFGGLCIALIAIGLALGGLVSMYTPVLLPVSLGDHRALAVSFFDGRFRIFYFRCMDYPVRVEPVYVQMRPEEQVVFPILGKPILPRIRLAGDVQPVPDVLYNTGVLGPRENLREDTPAELRSIVWTAPIPTDREPTFDVPLGTRRNVSDFGGSWRVTGRQRLVPVANPPIAAEYSYFRVPVWLPIALLVLFPVRIMILGPWRERRRRKRNQCIGCGYSLKALTEPRCPECGTIIPDKAQAA